MSKRAENHIYIYMCVCIYTCYTYTLVQNAQGDFYIYVSVCGCALCYTLDFLFLSFLISFFVSPLFAMNRIHLVCMVRARLAPHWIQ